MKPKRQSLWDRKRQGWYRDAARTNIIEAAGWLLWLFFFGTVGLIVNGIGNVDSTFGQLSLVAGIVCAASFFGLRTGKAWARLLGGSIATLLALTPILPLLSCEEYPMNEWILGLTLAAMWAGVAYGLLGPGSSALFEQARTGIPPSEKESAES